MIRTKYLFIVMVVCAVVGLATNVFFFVQGSDTFASALVGEAFFGVPQDMYEISPNIQASPESERTRFIEKIRNALVHEPRDVVVERVDVPEVIELSQAIEMPVNDLVEDEVSVLEVMATTSVGTTSPVIDEVGTTTNLSL